MCCGARGGWLWSVCPPTALKLQSAECGGGQENVSPASLCRFHEAGTAVVVQHPQPAARRGGSAARTPGSMFLWKEGRLRRPCPRGRLCGGGAGFPRTCWKVAGFPGRKIGRDSCPPADASGRIPKAGGPQSLRLAVCPASAPAPCRDCPSSAGRSERPRGAAARPTSSW